MESALLERDRVGVQDFVLLNDHLSLDEFIANLEKRFKNDLIYMSAAQQRLLCYIALVSAA